jgi:hypothetical protein
MGDDLRVTGGERGIFRFEGRLRDRRYDGKEERPDRDGD